MLFRSSSLERFQKDLEKSIKALNHKYSEYDYYDEYDYYHDDEPEMTEEEEASQYNDFANTIRCYITRSIKEANNDNDNDYLIATFKLLLNAVDNCSMTTYNYSSLDLYSILITAYKKQLEDKDIFARILSTLVDLRTKKDHYFYDDIDSALCENISTKWQAEYLVSYFNDLEKILEKDIFKKITIIYNFIDKEKALKEAEKDSHIKMQLDHDYNQENIYTIKNELVKSKGEAMIANFLFMHNISYDYEKVYPELLDNNKPYHPDFTIYLGTEEIYIEYFGLSEVEDGKYNRYKKNMLEKIKYHKAHHNKFIGLDYNEGQNLLSNLRTSLEYLGFKLEKIDNREIISKLLDRHSLGQVYSLRNLYFNCIEKIKSSVNRNRAETIIKNYLNEIGRAHV